MCVITNHSTWQIVNPQEYRGMATSTSEARESSTQEKALELSSEDQGVQLMTLTLAKDNMSGVIWNGSKNRKSQSLKVSTGP